MRPSELFANYFSRIPTVRLLLFGAALFWISLFHVYQPNLWRPDQLGYAKIGRNLLRGVGFTNGGVVPYAYKGYPVATHPNLGRPPIFPVLVAISFAIAGLSDAAAIAVSGAAYIGAVVLTFYVAKELYTSRVGFLSAALLATSYPVMKYSISAYSELTSMFFLIGTFYLIVTEQRPAAIGVFAAFSYLTRYNLALIVPLIFVYLFYTHDESLKSCIRFVMAVVLVCLPWWLRTYFVTGSPFYSIQSLNIVSHSELYGGFSAFLYYDPISPLEFILSYPGIFISKIISNVHLVLTELPVYFGDIIFLSAIPGSLAAYRYRESPEIHLLILAVVTSQVIVLSIFNVKLQYFTTFAPFVALVAGFGLDTIYQEYLSSLNVQWGQIVVLLILAIAMLQGVSQVHKESSSFQYTRVSMETVEIIQQETESNDVIVADFGVGAIGWYGDRPTSPTPYNYTEMRKRYCPDYMLLFPQTVDRYDNQTDGDFNWIHHIKRQIPSRRMILYETNCSTEAT